MISRERLCEVFAARLQETGDLAEALMAVAREGAATVEADAEAPAQRASVAIGIALPAPQPSVVRDAEVVKLLEDVVAHVSSVTGISASDIRGRVRKPPFVAARRVVMLVLKRFRFGPKAIGRLMGLDHATVILGLEVAASHPDLVAMADVVLARLDGTAGAQVAA